MCTLTILPYKEKREILIGFNRDELRNRKIAIPPQIYVKNNIKFFYPQDANFGGTWLGFNEYGFFFFLLNYNQKNLYKTYLFNKHYKNKKSRGFIIPDLLISTKKEEVLNNIMNLDYYNYSPFRLTFYYLKDHSVFQFNYTGRGIKIKNYHLPFFQASSGLGDHLIYPLRKKIFRKQLCNNKSIKNQFLFHEYQDPIDSNSNILVNRTAARTVSQTFIWIQYPKAIIHYRDRIQNIKHKYEFVFIE